jgi:hypothetical protein
VHWSWGSVRLGRVQRLPVFLDGGSHIAGEGHVDFNRRRSAYCPLRSQPPRAAHLLKHAVNVAREFGLGDVQHRHTSIIRLPSTLVIPSGSEGSAFRWWCDGRHSYATRRSILRRDLLGVVDHDDIHRPFLLLQLEAELRLQRGLERRAGVRIGCSAHVPIERDIVFAG